MEEEFWTIDFKALFSLLWKEKWWLILITGLFITAGVVYSGILTPQFISKGRLLPEVQGKSSGLGSLSGFASMMGINTSSLAAGSDALRPDLYPEILKGIPFYLTLMDQKINTKSGEKETFEEYYVKDLEENKDHDPELLQKYNIDSVGILNLSRLDELRIEDLKERISASIDMKSGVISIQSKFPDPVVAAEVTRFAMEYLMEYVIHYRTEKLRNEVDFLAEKVGQSKGKYYSDQERKAQYADQFRAPSIQLQSSDVRRERLETEYRMSAGIYNELLKKYEEAKLQLQQEIPVFKVLDPPTIPMEKSEPRRALIVIAFTMIGGLLALAIIFLKKSNYKNFLKSS